MQSYYYIWGYLNILYGFNTINNYNNYREVKKKNSGINYYNEYAWN